MSIGLELVFSSGSWLVFVGIGRDGGECRRLGWSTALAVEGRGEGVRVSELGHSVRVAVVFVTFLFCFC